MLRAPAEPAGTPGGLLRRPADTATPPPAPAKPDIPGPDQLLQTPVDPPLGFSGKSSIAPTDPHESSDFIPIEDRWRIGYPDWDRYGKGHPPVDDYPYVLGHWYDPFNLNVIKGDYPISGQHTFLEITATSLSFVEGRQLPTPTTPFESTTRPRREEFFGSPNQFVYAQYLKVTFDLFHGDAAFKPMDWRIKVTPVFNVNNLSLDELAVVNPDVTKGTTRSRTFMALEEYFAEYKLMDNSPDYDFTSIRLGNQYFNSDFRGFLFNQTNKAARIFGTRLANRAQFNVLYFRPWEKDTNSLLNTFRDRPQDIVIANLFFQDFIWPGYTAQVSVHWNHDHSQPLYDKNLGLVRPEPTGIFQTHRVDAAYVGWAGDGHINRYNITHQVYWALGHDTRNPLAGQSQDISAWMAALELSYDRDWARFRTSFFFASGDDDITNKKATGFDTIFDEPNFAGGKFSFWNREQIKLFGTNLKNILSLVPDLRASKTQGQPNFVNPGLWLYNVGVDFDVTPKIKMINNFNLLWFDETATLETFTFDGNIRSFIGMDLSSGVEYRPLLSNNIIFTTGFSMLIPGGGFKDLYDRFRDPVNPLMAGFMELILTY